MGLIYAKVGDIVQLIPDTEDYSSDDIYYSLYLGKDLTIKDIDYDLDDFVFLEETDKHPFLLHQIALKLPKTKLSLHTFNSMILWETEYDIFVSLE